MTRLELLQLVIGRARSNGFEFRRWYTARLELPWISSEAAVALLAAQRRYYALVFSHEFAQAFWKPGEEISFEVPPGSFQRTMPDGSVRTVQRKKFMRRSVRPNAWRYHLRQMAASEEPLRYLRKYLRVEDSKLPSADLRDGEETSGVTIAAVKPREKVCKSVPRPVSKELPTFLQRPYRPSTK